MYKLYLIKDSGMYDITEITGSISWSDNVDTLGMELSFSIPVNTFNIEVGDKIIFQNDDFEIFRGIIVTQSSDKDKISFTCFDFGFYLNKSEIIKQFINVDATTAIKQICAECSIEVKTILQINTLINHIYADSTVSDTIKDILEQATAETGKGYYLEMQEGKLCILEKATEPIKAMYKDVSNMIGFDITLAVSNPQKTFSIEEMKNSVLIKSSEESIYTLAEAKSQEDINKYGLLQLVESIDVVDLNKAQNVAENKLKELNKVTETISVELLGNDKVRSNRILNFNITEKVILQGLYWIKSCSHTLSNGIHKMNCELEKVSD